MPEIEISWGDFLLAGLVLMLGYLLLQLMKQVIDRITIPRYIKEGINDTLRRILLLYEPLALVFWGSVFVMINPALHGLFTFLFVVGGFPHLRNYLSGRLFLVSLDLGKGTQLHTHQIQGTITRMGRLGLHVQTSKGRTFLGYTRLLKEGFTQITEEEIGGYYTLELRSPDKIASEQILLDLLSDAPYLDWSHYPEIVSLDEEGKNFSVRLLVQEESHLHELVSLFKESGYPCRIIES